MRAIEAESLSKRFELRESSQRYVTLRETLVSIPLLRRSMRPRVTEIWALRDVSFAADEGEVVGVIGRNGAGKSTLLKVLARITQPTTGVSRTRGRVGALLEVGTGFHPELTGRENIALNGAVLGMSRRDIRLRFDEIVEFAEVGRFLDTPLKRYSSGMYLRLAFSIAAHLEPDIVVVDEILAVGDAEFQRKCLGKMSEFGVEGRTVVFVSHDLAAIRQLCSRVIWLEKGSPEADGPTGRIADMYLESQISEGLHAHDAPDVGGAVRILSVALTDAVGGGDLDLVRRGDPFGIRLCFANRDHVAGLDVAFYLLNLNYQGVRVLDTALSDDPRASGSIDEPREYELSVTIPPVLPAGEYVLGVWIGGWQVTLLRHEALTFRVWPRADDAQESIERRRLVQPSLEWHVAEITS